MDFIPIAEESGLILQIGNWVLEEGCRQLHNWRQGYPELELTMSINLSRKQLAYPDLLERVERLIVANAIPANSLKLEITESTVMENGTASIGVLQAIRAMGVHLWMDDFGTGYSSLSCLHRFPLNGIKIDRAFIRNVSERRDYAAVVHAIVSLASNLGMHVVAEGVETEDQVTLLKTLECHLGQGYLFSKPMDAKTAEAYIQKYTPLSRAA
jgi:EAL domain-containing protein (putative c-di-GMP-specific phosphodiesterase class I)